MNSSADASPRVTLSTLPHDILYEIIYILNWDYRVEVLRSDDINNQGNYAGYDRHWNPWLLSLAGTCHQLRVRVMDKVILRYLRIRGLKESELKSALEVFGRDRLKVTRYRDLVSDE